MNQPSRSSSGALTLEQRYYLDTQIFAAESRDIFRRHWLCVGRASQVKQAGSYLLCEVDGESLLVVRGDDGQLRCFYNVCRHRGTRLCSETTDKPLRALRCPYHAWTYDLRGQLVSAPNMRDVAGFECASYPLKAAAVASWQGFVWVNLDESPVAAEEWFEPLDALLGPWSLDDLIPVERLEYDVAANWKLLFQNYSECYHCPWVHPALNALSPYKSAGNDLDDGPFLGGPMALSEHVRSMTMDGKSCADPLPGLDAQRRRQVAYYTLFPSVFLSPHPDFMLVHTIQPRTVSHTRVVCEFLFHPTAVHVDGFDPRSAVAFWDQTNRQDWRVCELSQAGIASSAYEPGPYSNLESLLAAFDRYYLRALGN